MSPSMNSMQPLAIVAGVRTPFAKAFTALNDTSAVDLGVVALKEAVQRAGLELNDVGEVVMGNVSSPADAANIGRVVALKSGVPFDRPAHTVNRNCASGMESIFSAWQILREGRTDIVVAGGTESMSQVPFLFRNNAKEWFLKLQRAKSLGQKLSLLTQFRPRMVSPIPGLKLGLKDPSCGLSMGETAEILAKEFGISREDQDRFAMTSHQRAAAAWERCFLGGEVTPVSTNDGNVERDIGLRPEQSMEALAKLKPIFDRESGTVTAGNSCPITDGAAALVLMSVEKAASLDVEPLGFVHGYAVAGCDPRRMGLGPVYAIHKLLQQTGSQLTDFELFEINEAFAAQVLACQAAATSKHFCEKELGRGTPLGEIPHEQLNVNGGAIALGHPVGTTGTRLVLTLLRALKERGLEHGLASLCVGGGQGAAVWVSRSATI